MNDPSPSVQQAEKRAQRALSRKDYERYLPLVRRTAMRFARRVPSHITVQDLIGYGWVGLMEALSRARPDMAPEEFEAYALYRIRGAMLDHLRQLDDATRETRRISRKIAQAIRDVSQRQQRAPEETEIAAELKMTIEEYHSALKRVGQAGMARLEMLDLDRIDFGRDDPDAPEASLRKKEMVTAVTEAIPLLPAKLQQVLALYYQEECTLKEIGAILGVTESRVSQLHTEAVHRLRAAIGGE